MSSTIRRITADDDPAREGFVETYREVFGEEPYNEPYARETVISGVWVPHLREAIFVAEDTDGRVVALACAHGRMADINPDIRDFVLSQPALPGLYDPAGTVHMSELAVRRPYRGRGLATRLILARLRWALAAGYVDYEMCTDASFSMSRSLYQRMGARLAPFVQDLAGREDMSASMARVFLYGKIVDAIGVLEREVSSA